jgi:hypothetical protein
LARPAELGETLLSGRLEFVEVESGCRLGRDTGSVPDGDVLGHGESAAIGTDRSLRSDISVVYIVPSVNETGV